MVASRLLLLGDVLALVAAFFLARFSHSLYLGPSSQVALIGWWENAGHIRFALFLGLIGVALVWFWSKGHYHRRRPFWDELHETLKILFFVSLMDAALVFLGKWFFSRFWLFSTWALAMVLVPAMRVWIKAYLARLGFWQRPAVIFGVGRLASETAKALSAEHLMGLKPVGFYHFSPLKAASVSAPSGVTVAEAPEQITMDQVPGLLRASPHAYPIIALEEEDWRSGQAQELLQRVSSLGFEPHIVRDFSGVPLFGLETTPFLSQDVLLVRVPNNLSRSAPSMLKRLFDLLAASVFLFASLPLLIWITVNVYREDGGPALFWQWRIGRDGKRFRMLKFRTMVCDADARLARVLAEDAAMRKEYAQFKKLRNDPRVTGTGRWLRATSLDELPQLWNVLKGEMSLVGPRPLLEKELACYGANITYYREARPGITGLWQISGRSNLGFHDRAQLDAWYVRNWSLWHDVVILAKTAKVVLKREGAY